MSQTHLLVPIINATPQSKFSNGTALKKTWKERLEESPLRYALLIIVTTASITAGVMGWVQVVRADLAMTKYEAEKAVMKNECEARVRDLRNKIAELEKRHE
jgi:hypothetical protein